MCLRSEGTRSSARQRQTLSPRPPWGNSWRGWPCACPCHAEGEIRTLQGTLTHGFIHCSCVLAGVCPRDRVAAESKAEAKCPAASAWAGQLRSVPTAG